MSARLGAAACAVVGVWVELEATGDVASVVAELLHAPMTATAASAAAPVAAILIRFTRIPFVIHIGFVTPIGSTSSLPIPDAGLLVVL